MKFLRKTLVGPYEHVLRDDPALDQKAEGFAAAYDQALETGDWSKVPRHPGQEPVVWILRHLTAAEWRWVQDINARCGLNSACLEATALALESVRGVELEVRRAPAAARRGFESVVAEQIEQLTSAVINDIGLRVVAEQGPRNG